jgi:hypothetical protein
MGIKLQGGNDSTNLSSVTALNQLRVTTPLTGVCAGFVQATVEDDVGDVLGSRKVLALEASDDYRLRSGLDQTVFNASFEGTVIPTNIFFITATTMIQQVLNGFLTLNSTKTLGATDLVFARTYRQFPIFGTYPTYIDMWIRESNMDSTNTISEWGLIYTVAAGTQQLTDAIVFRRTSGGQLRVAIVNNNIDVEENAIDVERVPSRNGVGMYDPTQSNHYLIAVMNDVVRFWINDVLVSEIKCPSAQATFSSASSLPVGFRVLNIGIPSTGRQIAIGYVNVGLGDQNTNKPWSHVLSGMGQGAYQTQIGSAVGPTVTRSAVGSVGHPNSATVRIAGSWAAQTGPNLNSLGGLWTSPAMSTLTSDADYPIFSYLNPVGTAALPGKTLYVTGIRIGETNATVGATGGGGMFLSYIAMPEASATGTNTSDSATTTSGKSIVLGGQGFATGNPAGTMTTGFDMSFNSPLVIPTGKYLHIVVRPFGTITANTLVVTGSVAVNGYHE